MAAVHGADGPLLESTMKAQLEMEEKVLKGEAERVVVSMCGGEGEGQWITVQTDGAGCYTACTYVCMYIHTYLLQ